MRIHEYGTGLEANQIKSSRTVTIQGINPHWFNEKLLSFDCVVEFRVKKKVGFEQQMKQTAKYIEFMDWCRNDTDAVIHLFPKEEKQKAPPPSTAPTPPSLWDEATTTSTRLRKDKGGGVWILDALYYAAEGVQCVSAFSRNLLLEATKQFKKQLKTANLTTDFVPVVGGSWYVYTDYRLLNPSVKLHPDTKYCDPNNMNMPGQGVPKGTYTFVGIRYREILSAAGSPEPAILSQLLDHPCDILNSGLDWPTRHWFMVACLAEGVRHHEWHLLARIAIDLYSQGLLTWRALVCEELWAPQTDDAVRLMQYYKDHEQPHADDRRYTQRCIALIITWMMTKHQAEAPDTVFEEWLRKNLRAKLDQLAASVDKKRWTQVPNLNNYKLQIAPPPQQPVVVQVKPKTGMELFQERIAQAEEHKKETARTQAAVLLQSAARGFLARQQLASLKDAQQSNQDSPPSQTDAKSQ